MFSTNDSGSDSASDSGSQVPPAYEVRVPTVDDAAGIAAVHIAVWRSTYAGLMRPEVLAGLSHERYTARWLEICAAAADPANPVVTKIAVHRQSGEPVGFASFGPARDDDAPTADQLWAINVLADHHGTGVANQLLQATIGERAGYLWVVEGNARARGFYRRHGFAEDGTTLFDDDLGCDEVRMVRFGSGAAADGGADRVPMTS